MSEDLTQKIAYLGTFHPAVPTLRGLAERGWIGVVVLPESAGEKNDELIAIANEFNIPYSYNLEDIERYAPVFVLAANYPKIVPQKYLDKYICINTHWGLLPRWRGVHPTAWATINGDKEIGLTVHMMEDEVDIGAIIAQDSLEVTDELDFNEMHEVLAEKQADCVLEVFENYLKTGVIPKRLQNEHDAAYVPKRVPEDGIIDWEWPVARIAGLIRALPLPKYPGAFTFWGLDKIIICSGKPVEGPVYYSTPGQVVRVKKDGSVWVKAGDGCLEVFEIMTEDDPEPRKPSELLRFGAKLGFVPQRELPALKKRILYLEERLDKLFNNDR